MEGIVATDKKLRNLHLPVFTNNFQFGAKSDIIAAVFGPNTLRS